MRKELSVGHHFIVGLSGTTLTDLDKKILEELKPSGILFLKRNFLQNASYPEWIEKFATLIDQIKAYTNHDKLFLSIDHEGGRVHRVPYPITHFPYAAHYKEESFAVASVMATELKSIGINLSWSPCADINSNPANPVIGERAFADTAELCAKYASSFFRGLMENGILACIKHFPGHGDTNKDSHYELPTLNLSYEEIKRRELIPFKELINQGAPLVMTSHIVFPSIDPDFPATLSSKILKDILRKELNFGGVIVTDDLDMSAVNDNHKSEDLVKLALGAGCELFIVARHPDGSSDKPLTMAYALQEEIDKNPGLLQTSEEAKEKIHYLLKHAVGNYKPKELNQQALDQHQQVLQRLA